MILTQLTDLWRIKSAANNQIIIAVSETMKWNVFLLDFYVTIFFAWFLCRKSFVQDSSHDCDATWQCFIGWSWWVWQAISHSIGLPCLWLPVHANRINKRQDITTTNRSTKIFAKFIGLLVSKAKTLYSSSLIRRYVMYCRQRALAAISTLHPTYVVGSFPCNE